MSDDEYQLRKQFIVRNYDEEMKKSIDERFGDRPFAAIAATSCSVVHPSSAHIRATGVVC